MYIKDLPIKDLQKLFDVDLDAVRNAKETELPHFRQNDAGDMLVAIAQSKDGNEKIRLWRNFYNNGGGIAIEHCGFLTNYKWLTIFKE